jgi:hypothetical protein
MYYVGDLHEMCHTFILVYACRTSRCDKQPNRTGYDGHGPTWAQLATAVQGIVSIAFGLDLDLGIEYSRIRGDDLNAAMGQL